MVRENYVLTGAIPGVNSFKNYVCKSTRYASSAVLFKQVVTLEHLHKAREDQDIPLTYLE